MSPWKSLRLRLLDSRFEISASDEWLFMLGDLWAPFHDNDGPPGRRIGVFTTGDAAHHLEWDSSQEDFLDPWELGERLSHLMTSAALSECESAVCLHGGVVRRGGETVVLLGGSGVGKTTTVCRFVSAGWEYLSDDLAPIAHSDGGVLPFPKPLSIKGRRAKEAAVLWKAPEWALPMGKTFQVPPRVFDVAVGSSTPTTVIFPDLEGAHWSLMTPGKGLVSIGQFVDRIDARKLRTLGQLCRTARLVTAPASPYYDLDPDLVFLSEGKM